MPDKMAGIKYRGKVVDVNDPDGLGRIRAELLAFAHGANRTPWCLPCAFMAGPLYGAYFMPQLGDEVFVELTGDGQWIYSGFYWSHRIPKPADGTPGVRVLRMPGGQQLKFDSAGNIEITCPGDLKLKGDSKLVVSTGCVCSYTGAAHPQGVTTIRIKGV